jgi:GDP/UDP-N,N'-diacetylbacillosamine 2-epimerase (hydrolysing)
VIFTGYDKKEILQAIIKSTSDKNFIAKVKKGRNPYGDGHSVEKIVNILQKIELSDKLLYKNITYK